MRKGGGRDTFKQKGFLRKPKKTLGGLSMKRLFLRDQRGFTLVELLIVVAIIAILAAIAIPQFAKYREAAGKSACQSDVRNCVSKCAAEYALNPGNAVADCDCIQSPGNTVTGSTDAQGVITATASCTGAYAGSCSYDNDTGTITCNP